MNTISENIMTNRLTNRLTKRGFGEHTDILCWDGSTKKASEIRVGDELVGDDGLKRVVLDTWSGSSQMYLIEQNLGSEYEISSENLITVRCDGNIVYKGNKFVFYWVDKDNLSIKSREFPISDSKRQTEYEVERYKKDIYHPEYIDIPIETYIGLTNSVKRLLYGVKLNVPIQWNEVCSPAEDRMNFLTEFLENSENIIIGENMFIISQLSQSLIIKVQRICQSLGLMTQTGGDQIRIFGKGIEKISDLCKCCFSSELPDMSTYGFLVSQLEVKMYYGFEVDKNNRFVLGDYTITHN